MAKNKDSKFAGEYQIPVEVLRDGLPQLLRDAPDDEVRGGNLIRVATAAGLANALSKHKEIGSDALQVYLVYYIAPHQAQEIEAMAENMEKQAEAGGAGAAAARFVVVNERVLQAKVLALMSIRGEIDNIIDRMKEVRAKKEVSYCTAEPPLVDHGLAAGEHLKPLKQAYFASRAQAGHFNIAKATLKCIDRALFKSLLQSFPMTALEQQEHLMELAVEYQQQYPQHKSLAFSEIGQQLIGLLAFLDFQDKKRMLTSEDIAGVSHDRNRVLKLLKRQKLKFKNMLDKESLLGAEFVDFPRL